MTLLKKTQTILFISLILAMILPFSGMNFAEAKSENEKKNEDVKKIKEEEKTKKEKKFKEKIKKKIKEAKEEKKIKEEEKIKEEKKTKKEKWIKKKIKEAEKEKKIKEEKKTKKEKWIKEMNDKGLKLYPVVGWVNTDDKPDIIWRDHPTEPGTKIWDVDEMIKQRIAEGKFDESDNQPYWWHGNTSGWNIAAAKLQSETMTKITADWIVPEKPVNNEGTIYYFNALQPMEGVIFQPVLQYGHSPVCDAGDNWVTYPLMYILGSVNVGECIPANVGDQLHGSVIKTEGYIWTVSIENEQNPQATDSVRVGYYGNSPKAFVALETYNLPRNCNALSGDIVFKNISIEGDNTNWRKVSNAPQWCGMKLVVLDNGETVQINNDN